MLLKKIFATSLISLIFISIFYGIYFLVFKKESGLSLVEEKVDNSVKDSDIFQDENSLDLMNKKISVLTKEEVISATISIDDGNIYFYDKEGGLWSISDGSMQTKKVVTKNFSSIKSVEWSNDAQSSIIMFNDGKIVIFNKTSNQEIVLKKGVDVAIWSSIPDKILYKFYDDDKKERSLNISKSDGSNWKKVTTLPFRYTSFQKIPASIQVAFWQSADTYTKSDLFKVNIVDSSEPVKIINGQYGADYLFSKDGNKFLTSFVTEQGGVKMSLAVVDSQGTSFKDFKIPTIVQKVVWSKDNKTIYYAQPSGIPDKSVMPNDYLEKKFITQDTFWRLDVTTGKKERLIELEELTEQIDATNLFLSKTEDALFFINRKNNLLYRLSMD